MVNIWHMDAEQQHIPDMWDDILRFHDWKKMSQVVRLRAVNSQIATVITTSSQAGSLPLFQAASWGHL